MKDDLTLLIRHEIAKLSLRASFGVFAISVIAFISSFGIETNALTIKILSLISIFTIIARVDVCRKIWADPKTVNQKLWLRLKMTYWLNATLWSAMFCMAALEMKGSSPHYFILFAMLTGFVANSLYTVSLDASIFIPIQVVVLSPLVVISLFRALAESHNYFILLVVSYFIYLFYIILQFKIIREQHLERLKNHLDLQTSNLELQNTGKQKEYFLNLVLELTSKSAPISTVLESIVLCIEQFDTGTTCSILLLNKAGTKFETVAAPGLPGFFIDVLTSTEIGPGVGSCGTSAYTGKRVIVEDIQTNPFWTQFKDLAKEAKMGSSWSEPIIDIHGKVLGTFALYHHEPHTPSEKDIGLIKHAAELVAIVLQQYEVEKNLKHTQDQLSLIYNNSIDAMWLINVGEDGSYRFDTINDAFVAVTGLTRVEVLDKTIEEVLPPTSHELVRTNYAKAIETGQVVNYFEIAPLPSGTKTGLIRVVPIKDNLGRVNKLLGVAEDITDRKQMDDLLREREADLIYAQHVAHLGNWKWTLENEKVEWSREVFAIFGMDPNSEPLPFSEQYKLYTPESWERLKKAVSNAVEYGSKYALDLESSSLDRNFRWVLARGEVTERDAAGNPTRMAGTVQNITVRKELERNLTSALKARDEFFLVASHELKTPLTTLQLSLHGIYKLLNADSSLGNPKLITKLDMAKKQSERLEVLVKNLLDVSRVSNDGVDLQTIPDMDISKLTEEVSNKYEEELQRAGSVLTRKIQPEVMIECDPIRIEQVLTNLLTNAMKYGGGKPVELNLKMMDSKVRIEVRDHGIGIPFDKLTSIFERFTRAVDEHSYKGLGLGLWIVKEIVQAHNGHVWAESEIDKGSLFVVELPFKVTT